MKSLPLVLFVTHARGGGVERHIADLVELLRGHVEILVLQPDTPDFFALRRLTVGEDLWFPAAEWDRLVAYLATLGIDRIHYHHIDGLPPAVLELPARLGCGHDLTLHDYYPACPGYHLADATGRYCASDPQCQRCLDGREGPWPMSIAQWREAFGTLLASAQRVIAPSGDAARRIQAFYPRVSPVVWPHPERDASASPARARVLVPGAISAVKGLEVLRACMADASQRSLPLHFVVVGFVGDPLPVWPDAPLTVTGQYPEGTLAHLLAHQGGDVVFFPAQCPETFSYTLSVALDSGLPIVASDLGAFSERLASHPGARCVRWNASAAEMNDALLAASARRRDPAIPAPRARTTFEAYRAAYLAGLVPADRATGPDTPPAIDPAWRREPPRKREAYPLAYLYSDGIVAGKASSREQLRHYAYDPDAMNADRDARFMELIQALGNARNDAARREVEHRAELELARGNPILQWARRLLGR